MERANKITKKLVEEILSQRLIFEAENKSLKLNLKSFNSKEFLKDIIETYTNDKITKGKNLKIDSSAKNIKFTSDKAILRRILVNILKNALEATPKDGTVSLGCNLNDNKIEFWVHNPGFIPKHIQLQIFHRSFSTKDQNRGIGTYSMKLLSSFLDGDVNFSSSKEDGTVFNVIFPLNLEN